MAKARIAINGFGRIGRVTLRILVKRGWPLELVAINDHFLSPQVAAHLTKYDTVYGRAPFPFPQRTMPSWWMAGKFVSLRRRIQRPFLGRT